MKFQCVLHGSFRKHFADIQRVHRLFTEAGIEVLAPSMAEIRDIRDGFAFLEGQETQDPRLVELLYLHQLKRLGEGGFSYFVNPEGYIGKSAAYELGIAHVSNVPCFFLETLVDHPAYLHAQSRWTPEALVAWIVEKQRLPEPGLRPDEQKIHRLWEQLIFPGSLIAVGGIIEYDALKPQREKEILLVKTHKWGHRFSIVGGKVRRRERLDEALLREVREETGLTAKIDRPLCTFDQIENSGYYHSGIQHVFVDRVVKVEDKKVQLNDEAQEYVWLSARAALRDLDIEPNARQTIELYANLNPTR